MQMEHVDEDENENRGRIPEDISVHLAISFFQYALQFCLVQPDNGVEGCVRIDRKQSQAIIAGAKNVTLWDDGGIGRSIRQSFGWEMEHPFLFLFEGKRASKCIQIDPRSGKGSPVYLIAICSTFISFIHFTFGSDYNEYLDATTVEEQKQLINDSTKDTFAYMSC
ncbi:hypothetical protein QQS21_001736 [Conoideocrella luteorostrata]|uniref:Uncharacterized protein n=1 Tax=Conoideocrella luteorostrata TaxID=1105319 RepID=A0AAJ0CWN2_9HYPO|nr:hypothetical protein QQS21_001736 [Conoideocrella luteorostrata]